MSKTRTTIVQYEDFRDPEFKAPSNHFFVNAFNERVFIHSRTRVAAQEWINENCGKGKYTVRVV